VAYRVIRFRYVFVSLIRIAVLAQRVIEVFRRRVTRNVRNIALREDHLSADERRCGFLHDSDPKLLAYDARAVEIHYDVFRRRLKIHGVERINRALTACALDTAQGFIADVDKGNLTVLRRTDFLNGIFAETENPA